MIRKNRSILLRIIIFIAFCVINPLAASGAQTIQGAFGQVLGERFDPVLSINAGLSTDVMWFEFMNDTPLPMLMQFRVLVTPLTYQIHSIYGVGTLVDQQTCTKDAKSLFGIVAEKYNSDEQGTKLKQNTEETFFLIDQQKPGRKITIVCEKPGILSVLYEDQSLKEKAKAEQTVWNQLYDDFQGSRSGSAVPGLKALADKNHIQSQLILGYAFRRGIGVPQDDLQAEAYYLRAAKVGMLEAQFNLGTFYFDKNKLEEAKSWLTKAAERGFIAAQNNLAQLYLKEGRLYNEAEAFRWFLSAAESGHVEAQYNTCHMYSAGDGIARNEVNAYKWCDIAAARGHSKAKDNRDFIANRMAPKDIERAKILSRQWIDAKGEK